MIVLNSTVILSALGAYLALINLYGFIIMGIDKNRAQSGAWRISEAHLLGAALLGGSLGVFMGMRTFRHKTKHRRFQVSVPLMLWLHVSLILYGLMKLGFLTGR